MRAVALLCFFVSGASGLIFEVIWTRMFSLVFGATTLAISTVLTAFMGGLALGSYLSGRFADRLRDPLRAYALAEAGVGITALLLPLVVGTFGGLNRFLYAHFAQSYATLAAIRFLASAAVMVVPTTLMGATLPLLSRFFVQTEAEHARMGMRVGTLYAINTFGALIGTSLGGFVLLPSLGLSTTNRLAACTNIGLALVVGIAYWVRRRLPARPPADAEMAALLEEVGPVPTVQPEIPRHAHRAALVAFALSGGVAMVYQVIWSRALSMTIGSSVYSFTLVLSAFLVGLAAGAAVIGRLAARSRNPVGWLSVNHLAVVLFVGLSYLLMDKLPFVFLWLIRGEKLSAGGVMWSQFLIALLIMLPATFAMGGILPLTIRITASGLSAVGRDVGSAYSVNTVGSIVGSFLAGFVVIPMLQLQPGLYAGICINLLIAAMMAWLAPWRRRWLRPTGIALALALAGGALLLPRWNLTHVSSGLFRLSIAREVLRTGVKAWKDPRLVFYRDGISTTVSVEQWTADQYSMKNNGKVDASSGDDMPTQIAVGLLPVLVHPRAPDLRARVALIGYASGVTAGAILQYPVSRVDVVELEPAIIVASAYFEHVNNKPLGDKRLHLVMDDGRNFLQAGSELYDVIINEPSNPWITGVSNLFTREYFETARRRLAPDGIFCSWAQMYEMSPRHIKSIYKTFSSVFPYVYAFSAEALSSDTFLIGSNRPLKLDLQRLRRAFAVPSIGREMKRAKLDRAEDLTALTLLAGPDEVRAYTIGADVNTDDNAIIEFGAPRDLYNHKRYDYYISKVYGQSWMYGRLEPFLTGYQTSEDWGGLVRALLINGKHREADVFARRVRPEAGPASKRATQLMQLLASRDILEEELPLTEGGPPLSPPIDTKHLLKSEKANEIAREYFMVEQRVRRRAYRQALDLIESWPDDYKDHAGPDFQFLWGYLVYKCLDFHAAAEVFGSLAFEPEFVVQRPAYHYYRGRILYGNADFAQAIASMERWIAFREEKKLPLLPEVKPLTEPSGGVLDVRPSADGAENVEDRDRPEPSP
jgi:spermidine synthase